MIELIDIEIHAGEFRIMGVNMVIRSGEYGVLMGRTGSGKSTILETIAGLRNTACGQIRLGDVDVTAMSPALRGVGFVPQDGALFATMTARENLGFALKIRRADREIIDKRVNELAKLLGIQHLLDRNPGTFSGGEIQRVALGRALAFNPRVLLLDEPLSAVDEETREEMYDLLKLVQRETNATILHVTHQSEEAERLADVRFHIKEGRVLKAGS